MDSKHFTDINGRVCMHVFVYLCVFCPFEMRKRYTLILNAWWKTAMP